MSLSIEPRNTEEAIEKLLLEQARLRKENQDLLIAKVCGVCMCVVCAQCHGLCMVVCVCLCAV